MVPFNSPFSYAQYSDSMLSFVNSFFHEVFCATDSMALLSQSAMSHLQRCFSVMINLSRSTPIHHSNVTVIIATDHLNFLVLLYCDGHYCISDLFSVKFKIKTNCRGTDFLGQQTFWQEMHLRLKGNSDLNCIIIYTMSYDNKKIQ